MRLSLLLTASVATGLLAADGRAGETVETSGSTVTLARHYTNNALDGPLAVEDWYTVLRGALAQEVAHENGATRLAAEFELRKFDTWDIEDDAAFAVSVETGIAASETVELRGTLSLKSAEQGDDLTFGDIVIGTTTRTVVLAAGAQAGLRLSADTVLALEVSASRETAGDTRFEDAIAMPVRLEPDRDRLRLAAALTRTQGALSYGLSGTAAFLRAGETALLPEIAVADYAAKLHAALAFANGATVTVAAGAQTLSLTSGAFTETRPVFELAAATPLPAGFSLRGTLKCGYDTVTTDDPVASWIRRVEVEAGYQHGPRLRFGVGAFAEKRDNLALGDRESAHGFYGETAWRAGERVDLVFRIDAARRLTSPFPVSRRTVDAQVALTARL